MSESDAFFNQYASPPASSGYAEETDPPTHEDHEVYKAFGLSPAKKRSGELMLRICLADGTLALKSYGDFTDAVCTPPYTLLTLIFNRTVIEIEGRNLAILLDHLQEGTLRYVRCFRPDLFAEPPAAEPFISHIARINYVEYMNNG